MAHATVDPEWFGLRQFRWHLFRGYAARTLSDGRKVLMHRLVVGAGDGSECHHLNGDRLDNRLANLTLTTKAEHRHHHVGHGVSGLRGVYPARSSDRWVARVKRHGQKITLGTFDTPQEASAVVEAWWAERREPRRSEAPDRLAPT